MRFTTRFVYVLFLLALVWTACDHRPIAGEKPDPPIVDPTDPGKLDPEQPSVSISSFIGTFAMTCIETYDRTNEKWNVKISYTSAKRNNGQSWVVISGLYYGNDFMNAYGYYDPNNKCIRIPANIPDDENTFYFTDDSNQADYYALFTPCLLEDDWSSFYYTHDTEDEMWLRMESNGQLRLGAAGGSSIEAGTYFDSYTFYYYYASTGEEPDNNYFVVITDAVFTRINSYSAPLHHQRHMKQLNHSMLLPGQKKNAEIVTY